MARVQCCAKVARIERVIHGTGPSSNVSTTSFGARKLGSCGSLVKLPMTGPVAVSISTVRATLSRLGLAIPPLQPSSERAGPMLTASTTAAKTPPDTSAARGRPMMWLLSMVSFRCPTRVRASTQFSATGDIFCNDGGIAAGSGSSAWRVSGHKTCHASHWPGWYRGERCAAGVALGCQWVRVA